MIYYTELKKKTLSNIVKNQIITKQIEDLKKKNEVLKEIITSKFDFNKNSACNNNTDNTWKTVKISWNNTVNNKVNNRRFNFINANNKYHPISIHENEVIEPRINNRMNNDVDKYKNTFNSNIESNVTTRKRRPTAVINQFPEREIHLVFLNIVKTWSQDIPSSMKQFVLVEKCMC